MRHRESLGRAATLVVSLVAAVVSIHLLDVHVDVAIGSSVGGLCGVSEAINCDAAATSHFATLLGIPIALLGLAFYLGAAVLALVNPGGKAPRRLARPAALLQTLYLGAIVYSLFLFIVSLAVLGSFCPFCGVLYVLNIAGFAAAWAWLGVGPRRLLPEQVKALLQVGRSPALITAAIVFVVTVGAGLLVLDGLRTGRVAEVERARALVEPPPAVDVDTLVPDHAATKGPDDAPVTLVEFSNFGCPFCARLAEALDAVMETHGDRLRVVYLHYPIRPDQYEPAIAAVCAQEQGRFWPLHDAMFENMPVSGRAEILRLAGSVGVDVAALEACMDDPRARAAVEADRQRGQELGVQGTPTFYINGRQHVGALPPAELRRLVDSALAAP